MKKFITNIKTLAALLMAGAAFTACSSDDNYIEQPAKPQVYTMTIKATKGDNVAQTRALNLDGSDLNAIWDANEEVLVYQGNLYIATLKAAASSTAETTLSGTLENVPDPAYALLFYYHTKNDPVYSGQDGTLATVSSSYDFRGPTPVNSGNYTVDDVNNEVTVPGGITIGSQKQAIVKFTFLDKADGTTLLNPTKITASLDLAPAYSEMKSAIEAMGIELPYKIDFAISAASYTENGEGVVYIAIPDKLAGAPSYKNYFNITITATVGDYRYTLTKSGFPFENGKYYTVSAKMTKQELESVTVANEGWIDSDKTIYFYEGEKWGQAIENHPTVNNGWYIIYGDCPTFTGHIDDASVYDSDDNDNWVSTNNVIDKTHRYYFGE